MNPSEMDPEVLVQRYLKLVEERRAPALSRYVEDVPTELRKGVQGKLEEQLTLLSRRVNPVGETVDVAAPPSDQEDITTLPASEERDGLVASVIAGFLLAQGRGSTPSPEELVAQHPEIESELKSFFSAHSGVNALATSDGAELAEENFGDFRILRRLGSGGMGHVYLVEQRSSGRRVALKVVRTRHRPSRELLDRFRREGQMAASVSHPRCVFVFMADEIDGTPFLAMEAMPGKTLQDLIEEQGPLPIEDAVDYTLQIIEGLEAAASKKVIHRDVKPSNCFLDGKGGVKIGDFGLSKSLEHAGDLTVTGSFIGTPLYASPEQVRGRDLDLRSDIYSLGATLYFLLTGRTPLTGGNAGDVLAAIVADDPTPIRSHRRKISKGLANVIHRLLAKDPGDRFADYVSLRGALEPHASGAELPAPLGRRFVAGFLDVLSVAALHDVVWQTLPHLLAVLPIASIYFPRVPFYFLCLLLFEGVLGASPAKLLLGFRVEAIGGGKPSFIRVLVRTAVFVVVVFCPFWLYDWLDVLLPTVLGPLLLVSTIGPWSRYRGIHELLSGTRVAVSADRRRLLDQAAWTALEMSPALASVPTLGSNLGPYTIEGKLFDTSDGTVCLGRDKLLDREVWLLVGPPGQPCLSETRRAVERPARQRWLQGGADDRFAWHALEAPAGAPVSRLAALGPIEWEELRHYLLHLARELREASQDGTLPRPLTIENVWVGPRQSLCLIDTAPTENDLARGVRQPIGLVLDTARVLLGGATGSDKDLPFRTLRIPPHAAAFLDSYSQRDDDPAAMEELIAGLEKLVAAPARITTAVRLASLAPAVLFLLAFGLDFSSGDHFGTPEHCLDNDVAILARAEFRLEGPDYPIAILTSAKWQDREPRAEIEQIVREARQDYPNPSPQDVQWAEDTVRRWNTEYALWRWSIVGMYTFLVLGGLAILWALVLRGGLMLRLLRVDIRGDRGEPAGRWRCVVRAAATWTPLLITVLAALDVRYSIVAPPVHRQVFGDPFSDREAVYVETAEFGVLDFEAKYGDYIVGSKSFPDDVKRSWVHPDYAGLAWIPDALLALSVAVLCLGAANTLFRPARALQDRIAGTHLAPRDALPTRRPTILETENSPQKG